jgi:hypothetical protein
MCNDDTKCGRVCLALLPRTDTSFGTPRAIKCVFGGRQPTFRNFSHVANVSSQETGTVQYRREETEAGQDVDDDLFMA